MNWVDYLILAGIGIVAIAAGAPLVGWLLRTIDPKGSEAAEKALPGGLWIGILERARIYMCVALGYAAGVAVVVAVKGLGRFGELKSATTEASERFIIGTLLSMSFAAGLGLLAAELIA